MSWSFFAPKSFFLCRSRVIYVLLPRIPDVPLFCARGMQLEDTGIACMPLKKLCERKFAVRGRFVNNFLGSATREKPDCLFDCSESRPAACTEQECARVHNLFLLYSALSGLAFGLTSCQAFSRAGERSYERAGAGADPLNPIYYSRIFSGRLGRASVTLNSKWIP